MLPTPFCNNLRRADRVYCTEQKRHGKVVRTPQSDGQRMTCIRFDGLGTDRYVDVMQLRLVPDGKTPEDLAPVDGEPPPLKVKPEAPAQPVLEIVQPSALQMMKDKRAGNAAEMDRMNLRFKTLRDENDRLDKAIAILSSP